MYQGRDTSGKFRASADRRDQRLSVRCHEMDLYALDEYARAYHVSRAEIALEIIRTALQRGDPIAAMISVPKWP